MSDNKFNNINITKSLDEDVFFYVKPLATEKLKKPLQDKKVYVKVVFYDKDKKELLVDEPNNVKVRDVIKEDKDFFQEKNFEYNQDIIVSHKFNIKDFLISKGFKEKKETTNQEGKFLEDVKYISCWIDANNDSEVSIEYSEEVVVRVCKVSLDVKTFIELVYFLRDKQNLKTYKESFFDLKREEQITDIIINKNDILKDNEKKIELFVTEMNKMFKKYQIITCYRRIHFLAQMYLETMSFRASQEALGLCNGYDGGCDFRGRGMKQLTHDYNYLGYYDYIYNTNYYSVFDKLRNGKYTSVKNMLDNKTILNEDFYNNKLIPFTKKISTDLFYAFDSAGWFSTIGLKGETNKKKLMDYMDMGVSNKDVLEVTKIINGGVNNLKERQEYTKWIKEFFGII